MNDLPWPARWWWFWYWSFTGKIHPDHAKFRSIPNRKTRR